MKLERYKDKKETRKKSSISRINSDNFNKFILYRFI